MATPESTSASAPTPLKARVRRPSALPATTRPDPAIPDANPAPQQPSASVTAGNAQRLPKPAKARVAKPTKTPAAKPDKAPPGKPDKASRQRQKPVRDGFTMPQADFALIGALKARALAAGRETRKSELLRAGLQALSALDSAALLAALGRLETVKVGRPKKGH